MKVRLEYSKEQGCFHNGTTWVVGNGYETICGSMDRDDAISFASYIFKEYKELIDSKMLSTEIVKTEFKNTQLWKTKTKSFISG